ncbi:MAG: deoxyribodipyrimidine photo-lyase [Legionella sp.]|nr:deoxyribodipyrimidine photo-lyase [Legionella sp.]
MTSNAIVWFRQDLRLYDNPAFAEACRHHDKIIPIYILDKIQAPVEGAQRWWLHHSLESLDKSLKKLGLNLCLRQGKAIDVLKQVAQEFQIKTIYWNRCYDPVAIERDTLIKNIFQTSGMNIVSTNGSLLHEPWQIKNMSGVFFKVFTPYWRACLKQMNIPEPYTSSSIPKALEAPSDSLASWKLLPTMPNWAKGFGDYWQPGEEGAYKKLAHFVDTNLKNYNTARDIPAKNATSRLSPHLHFGEISPWQIWRTIKEATLDKDCDLKSAERFLSEIGWREFSYYLLYHVPSLPNANYKSNFDGFPWENDETLLSRWQKGMTGYPIVDAGMRELWHTGYMHNRIRMIVASFLTKDLFIDWRIGASWFSDTLVDADIASNSASWQWVAGSGADAAPYFRIFNPILQGGKFDPKGEYVKKWVPELKSVPVQWVHKPWMTPQDKLGLCLGKDYPEPIVDHSEARNKALLHYKMIGAQQHYKKD